MNFKELAAQRFSARGFDKQRSIESEKLNYILETTRLAPSAVNFQPLKFFVVKNDELLHALSACYHREWFATAPICIVVCADHEQSWHRSNDGKDHADIDAAIAIDHLTLAASEQGLGTCWVCNFEAKQCAQLLNLPTHVEPIALVPMGYVSSETLIPQKKRKSAEELFQFID